MFFSRLDRSFCWKRSDHGRSTCNNANKPTAGSDPEVKDPARRIHRVILLGMMIEILMNDEFTFGSETFFIRLFAVECGGSSVPKFTFSSDTVLCLGKSAMINASEVFYKRLMDHVVGKRVLAEGQLARAPIKTPAGRRATPRPLHFIGHPR